MYRIYLIALILIVGFSVGCRRSTTVTGADGEKATVTQDGDNVEITVEGKDGGKLRIAANEDGVPLPDGFPKDVPLYPGAKVILSTTSQGMMNVSLESTAQLQQVRAYYEEKLKERGWEIGNRMNMPQTAMLHATKGKRNQTVTISRDDDKTMINLMLAAEGG